MRERSNYSTLVAFAVALGGFLMGFDSAVISGVVDPIKARFRLDADQLGWAVSCLTLGATAAMACAGPLADRFGRRPVLQVTALLFTVSAIGSALAPNYATLVIARIVGGFGVGGALLIAPIYIAEIAPAAQRGRLVSFNQLNIVLGFSAAFFSNYFLDGYFASRVDDVSDLAWRWMLGVETVPAVLYSLLLLWVPRSPRWLAMHGRDDEALAVLARANGAGAAAAALAEVHAAIARARAQGRVGVGEVLTRRMRRVMVIGLGLGLFQQITGINAIFYYSTTIFAMAGAARDVALGHAILVGIVNVVFTLVAMRLIDRLGRRPLLIIGTSVMSVALLTNAWEFHSATYRVGADPVAAVAKLGEVVSEPAARALAPLGGLTFASQSELAAAAARLADAAGPAVADEVAGAKDELAKAVLQLDGTVVLVSIMAYIAAFAISLGPVMWAMFSEIFPMRLRGVAISIAGFFNSLVSFGVQQLFPRGMETIGPGGVFAVFGGFALLGLGFTLLIVPETKGRSLEELETELMGEA
ncbi:MAG: sugar porter family MFS transporter [Planctomycetes bacterium]|nr:sugar porter family MFS transporter [Planctomycetota bacterium]